VRLWVATTYTSSKETRMQLHANAALGLAGRRRLVGLVEQGHSLRAATAALSVAPATAHRWWHRWLGAGDEARRTLSCLFDRSSRPHRSPRRLAPELEQAICACRRNTGWGPRLVAGATGFAHSTVWKVLRRAGISRQPRAAREPANRYEWPCPGDLLHMDVSRYARFLRPGHRVTGDRSQRSRQWMRPEARVGDDYAHAIVDVECPRFRGQLSAGHPARQKGSPSMPRKPKYRKPYPPEFRREAVALYARTDRTLGEIAGDLGVSRESLRLWVQQAQIERGERDGLTGDEREELRELRRRVLLLEQEREILKKAAAFFVKESETR
jgi:transposase-like protein